MGTHLGGEQTGRNDSAMATASSSGPYILYGPNFQLTKFLKFLVSDSDMSCSKLPDLGLSDFTFRLFSGSAGSRRTYQAGGGS